MKNPAAMIASLMLLAGACVFGYFVFLRYEPSPQDPSEKSTSGLLKTEAEFRDKLTELNMRRNKVQRGIKMLERDKAKTLVAISEKGILSGEDFKNSSDQEVKKLVINLREYNQQIEKIEKEVGYYDEAISSIRVMLEKIERERINDSIALSEQEYLDLQKIIVDLDERLNVKTNLLEDDELGKLLDLELSQEPTTGSDDGD